MRSSVTLVVSLAVALALGATTRAAQSPSGRIAGRVFDSQSQQPIRHAIVTVTGDGLANGRSAVTDDEGRFAVDRLPAGSYLVVATRPGFLKSAYGASRPGRAGTRVAVRPGAEGTAIAIAMTHGSAIGGTLRDAVGDVAGGQRVQAIRIRHTAAGDRAEVAGQVMTDDRGEFRLYGLAAGDYILAATPPIMTTGPLSLVSIPSEAELDARMAALRMGRSAPAGAPHAPQPSAPKPSSLTTTFYAGVTQSSRAALVTVGTAEERNGVDFATQFSRAATVEGVIVPAGGLAMPAVAVELRGDGPQLPVFGGSTGTSTAVSPRTDHSFSITNVPPGHYRLIAHTLGMSGAPVTIMSSGGALPNQPNGAPLWAQTEIDVAGDDVSGVTLTLQPVPAVTGALAAAGSPGAAPANLGTVRLTLEPLPQTDGRSNGMTTPIAASIQADGSVRWPSVMPGVYHLRANLPAGWVLKSAVTGDTDVLDGDVSVGADGISDLAITMTDRRSSIAGTLVGDGNLPATAYHLVAFAADRARWRAPSRWVKSSRPSTSGAFELTDLPPGEYYLAALSDLDASDLEDAAFLETLVPAAVKVTVAEGQTARQDLKIGG